ncbi:MAG TPA: NAD(P)/FAD-dependent oxidoreductase [Pseudonocardia sp.]|jgi:cation diffusion facilitator CzcD-associated flavoprotein CzcO|nr:NAD(P)/FAD-dependent oxidoreductase [Pseudonocardia sp.]
MPDVNQHEIVIIGAGPGGIAAGVKLKAAGFHDFVMLEKADEVGCTWRDNVYPGLTVDIPTITYSFSFHKNPDWSNLYAPQPELFAHLRNVVEEHGLRSHLRLGSTVADSRFDPESGLWHTTLEGGGSYVSRFLISATGFLSTPKWPDIEGLDEFEGKKMHTSGWDNDSDLAGKRVAFIGTGATGIQLIPEVVDAGVDALHVFQRTPIFLLPKADLSVAKPVRTAYDWGCKRPSFSNVFYPVFNRPEVELVTEPIARLTRTGIVTGDGVERPIDVLVCGTGFHPYGKESTPTYPVYGSSGEDLREYWDRNRYQAVRGFAINGYPNFFMIGGPYAIAHSSYIGMIESVVHNIVRVLGAARRGGADRVEVSARSQAREFEHILRKRGSQIFFVGNCGSSNTYYIDRFGDTPNFRPTYHPNVWWDSRFGKIEPHFEMTRGRTGRVTDPTPVGSAAGPGEPR